MRQRVLLVGFILYKMHPVSASALAAHEDVLEVMAPVHVKTGTREAPTVPGLLKLLCRICDGVSFPGISLLMWENVELGHEDHTLRDTCHKSLDPTHMGTRGPKDLAPLEGEFTAKALVAFRLDPRWRPPVDVPVDPLPVALQDSGSVKAPSLPWQ